MAPDKQKWPFMEGDRDVKLIYTPAEQALMGISVPLTCRAGSGGAY